MFLINMVRRLLSQVRICSSCGHRQPKQTHEDKRRDRCEKCGAALPTDRGTGTTGRG